MELREGYKWTEVGVIPEDWNSDFLDAFWSVTDCKHVTAKFVKSGFPVVSIGEVKNRFVNLYSAKKTTQEFYKKLTEGSRKPLPGDLILSRNATVGEIAQVADWHPPFAMGQDVCLLRKKSKDFSTPLLQAIFKSSIILRQLENYMVGSTFRRVNIEQVKKLLVTLPSSKAEQEAISEALSDADTLIESLTSLIAKKRQIKQGAMQSLLNPYENGRLKAGWVVKKLRDFLSYEQPTNYLVADTEYNDNNNTPVLTAGKTFVLGYTHEEFGVFNSDLPVIIFDDFTTASKFVDFPFKAKSSAMKILKRENEKVNLRFIYELLQRIDYPLGDHKRHWISEFQYLDICVPDDEVEQNRIATTLSDMDADIVALETKLAKTQQIKQGMMQNLLTGQIRLVKAKEKILESA
jgi:type I restriction enzyme S subunit